MFTQKRATRGPKKCWKNHKKIHTKRGKMPLTVKFTNKITSVAIKQRTNGILMHNNRKYMKSYTKPPRKTFLCTIEPQKF